MKLCVFHTSTIRASWSALAIPQKLRQMGHEVIDAPIPTNQQGQVLHGISESNFRHFKEQFPTIQQLKECDFILCLALEYYPAWLETLYGTEWKSLHNRVALYAESSDRLDYAQFAGFSDFQFYPDSQDAKKYGGKWIAPGVDTAMFHPTHQEKIYDVGFLGTLYPKRVQFLEALAPYLDGLNFVVGEVTVFDLAGENHPLWAELNVKNINQMKIHLALPGNNTRMPTARHVETLACGTFLLTTRVEILEDKVHCRFYSPEDPQGCANLIRYYLEHETERNHIATRGWAHVNLNYSMEKFLDYALHNVTRVLTA